MAGQGLRDWVHRNRDGLAIAVVGMLAVGLVAYFVQRPTSPVVIQASASRASPSPTPVAPNIAVHVNGEVLQPGLYQLPPGARVNDAIRVAGGPTGDADIQRLNLAARLTDGQQIGVPRKGDVRVLAGSPSPIAKSRININDATVAELDTLPGLGPVMAQRIVAHREQNGPFTRPEELREAKLVNASTYEKIKDLITP